MRLRRIGIFLALAGGALLLYLCVRVVDARLWGAFASIDTDSPGNSFYRFQCPLLMNINNKAVIRATLRNPTDEDLTYSVAIGAEGFRVLIQPEPARFRVSARGTRQLAWTVSPTEAGRQAITVQAVSDRDRLLPGPFHGWPRSFRQGCGAWVMDGPLPFQAVVIAGLALVIAGGWMGWVGAVRAGRAAG